MAASGLRENGVLVVPNGLAAVALTVQTSAVAPAALTFAPHMLRRTVIQTDQPVRWTAAPGASNDPTASFGLKLVPGQTLVYDGPIDDLLFIRDATATADATVILHYFGL